MGRWGALTPCRWPRLSDTSPPALVARPSSAPPGEELPCPPKRKRTPLFAVEMVARTDRGGSRRRHAVDGRAPETMQAPAPPARRSRPEGCAGEAKERQAARDRRLPPRRRPTTTRGCLAQAGRRAALRDSRIARVAATNCSSASQRTALADHAAVGAVQRRGASAAWRPTGRRPERADAAESDGRQRDARDRVAGFAPAVARERQPRSNAAKTRARRGWGAPGRW